MILEQAHAKVNLVLRVGRRRADGLHELCSLFAALELADLVEVEPIPDAGAGVSDRVECPGVEGPNLAATALHAYREATPRADLPALRVRIEKRIPVAAGLAGGSADAAAVLRAADALAPHPLGTAALRLIATRLGSDVPSQVEPGHAIVTGAGEGVERVELPPLWLLLAPQRQGLSTAAVYAEADRLGTTRARLHPADLREFTRGGSISELSAALENDLEPAALSLRPELAAVRDGLLGAGALGALVSGSGPTVAAVFGERHEAERAAARFPNAIVTGLLGPVRRGGGGAGAVASGETGAR